MRKAQVAARIDRWDGKGALYVVAHAKWQQSRGRNPSEPYKEQRNPRLALKMALSDVSKFDPPAGAHIAEALMKMTEIARFTSQTVSCTFNGVDLMALPSSTPEELRSFFIAETNRRAEEYRNSSEYKAQALNRALEVNAKKTVYAARMAELPNLDFSNLELLLRWFYDFEACCDIDVPKAQDDLNEIVSVFKAHGYEPNVNCGEDFKEDDADNGARYIIGQCLSCLEGFGCLPQIVPIFIERWMDKFHPAPANTPLH